MGNYGKLISKLITVYCRRWVIRSDHNGFYEIILRHRKLMITSTTEEPQDLSSSSHGKKVI